jgi:cathepsin H
MESHYMIKYGNFRNLSEQQLVSCAGNFDNYGCNGGLPSHAFEYIKSIGGLTTESKYPYLGLDGRCKYTTAEASVGVIGGAVNITQGDENELLEAIFVHGPVSVTFQVYPGFSLYESGIYSSERCGNAPSDVNHAVLAVGFGTEHGVDYWIVKNSWSDAWGEQGYFRIKRGVNMCGIAVCNSYPQDIFDASNRTEII